MIFVLVVTVLRSRAAATVIILKTDPGSYTFETTGSMNRFGVFAAMAR